MPKAVSSFQAKVTTTPGRGLPPPTAGALLRMTYQRVRERQFAALIEKGFDDLNPPLLNVFLYPPPDQMRPSDLAERANMTKQAMNYLLGQLEARGYIERRAEMGSSRRLVFLTNRGWQVRETILAVATKVEAEWASVLGQKRFNEFMHALRHLWSIGQPSTNGRDVARGGEQSDRSPPQHGRKTSRNR